MMDKLTFQEEVMATHLSDQLLKERRVWKEHQIGINRARALYKAINSLKEFRAFPAYGVKGVENRCPAAKCYAYFWTHLYDFVGNDGTTNGVIQNSTMHTAIEEAQALPTDVKARNRLVRDFLPGLEELGIKLKEVVESSEQRLKHIAGVEVPLDRKEVFLNNSVREDFLQELVEYRVYGMHSERFRLDGKPSKELESDEDDDFSMFDLPLEEYLYGDEDTGSKD